MNALPWWLRPWHAAADARRRAAALETRLDAATAALASSGAAADQLQAEISSLRRQLAAAATDARVSGRALATEVPEFVMVGTARGSRGKRIHVSRDIEVTAFAMTEPDNPPPRFKIGAVLGNLLVIDKPTYGECLAHLAKIWANQDADARDRQVPLKPVQGPLQLPTGDT